MNTNTTTRTTIRDYRDHVLEIIRQLANGLAHGSHVARLTDDYLDVVFQGDLASGIAPYRLTFWLNQQNGRVECRGEIARRTKEPESWACRHGGRWSGAFIECTFAAARPAAQVVKQICRAVLIPLGELAPEACRILAERDAYESARSAGLRELDHLAARADGERLSETVVRVGAYKIALTTSNTFDISTGAANFAELYDRLGFDK